MKRILLFSLIIAPMLVGAQTHVVLRINNVYGNQPFYADNQDHGYTDWDGNAITFNRSSYYLSEFRFSDGTTIDTLAESHTLVKSEITEYYIGTTSVSNITDMTVGVGVDEPYNHLDPATYAAEHPLAHQIPNMHWGWTAGYKFLALEGNVDSDGDGSTDAMFQFHALEDPNYQKNVSIDPYVEMAGDTAYIWINVDHKGWIQSVNVPSAGVLHGSHPETDQMMDNSGIAPVFQPYSTVGIEDNSNHSYTFVDYRKTYAPTIRYMFEGVRNVDVQITDMNGRIIESEGGLNPQGEFNIWSEPASGIYLYSFISEGKVLVSEKFTVTR